VFKGKILIVDDVPKNIQMAMNILKNEGHKMFYAKDGKMALKLTSEQEFDFIRYYDA
jgi:putative two-component system response regulator